MNPIKDSIPSHSARTMVAWHDSLRVRFLISQAYPLEIYLFCMILSEVSNKSFSAKADFVLDSIFPSISVLDCSPLGGT